MEWLIQLTGDNYDLEELSKSLQSPELNINQEGEIYILKSSDFNSLSDADKVREKASEILCLINGSASLTQGMRKPLEIAHITLVRDDGTRNTFINLTATVNVRASVGVVKLGQDGTVQEIRPSDIVPSWVHAAQHDASVARVLELFGSSSREWVNLYMIYEIIEDDVGGVDYIQRNGWATKKAIRRFKHTANSYSALAEKSRHAIEKTDPPKDPMSYSEAKSLIESISKSWLHTKI